MKKLILLIALVAFLGTQAAPVTAAACGDKKTECKGGDKKESEKKETEKK